MDSEEITTKELAKRIEDMLLIREGMTITPELAKERANNISVALWGYTVVDPSEVTP